MQNRWEAVRCRLSGLRLSIACSPRDREDEGYRSNGNQEKSPEQARCRHVATASKLKVRKRGAILWRGRRLRQLSVSVLATVAGLAADHAVFPKAEILVAM